MPLPSPLLDDRPGTATVVAHAAEGIADVVEAAHAVVARPWRRTDRARGLTGWIYRTVRRSIRWAGVGAAALERGVPRQAPSRRQEALRAALNGVRGDALAASGNRLATPFSLRRDGHELDLTPRALCQTADPSDVLLVLVHGICMHDGQWGETQAAALAAGLGATEIRVRYNSGRHISESGDDLADGLEALLDGWPRPVRRLVIVGHSMGGLVARAALQTAAERHHRWPAHDASLVTLGSPHHGAPLERLGNAVDAALGATRWSRPFARIGQIRSAGVTDLRWGSIREPDWADRDRFERGPDRRVPTPLPPGVAVYAVAATTGDGSQPMQDQTVGDGLVPLDSALGRHGTRDLGLPRDRQWIARGMTHFDLTRRAEVTDRLLAWLAPSTAEASASEPRVA